MRVIDHQGEIVGYFFHLDSSLYFCIFQCLAYVFFGYVEMSADRNGGQGIVNTEFSWQIDLYREIKKSLQLIGNTQYAFLGQQFRIDSAKVGLR